MRENRGFLIAAGIFVVVAAAFIYGERQPHSPPSTSPTPQPSPLVGLSANQLQQVVIHSQGKVLTVTRAATGFNYTLCAEGQGGCQPQPADLNRSSQLFTTLASLAPSHVIYGAPEGLPAYGVDKPTGGEVDIKSTTNQQVTLIIGIKTPDGSSYFVKRQDSSDVDAVATGTIDQELLSLVASPPVPQPSPSPGASPSPS